MRPIKELHREIVSMQTVLATKTAELDDQYNINLLVLEGKMESMAIEHASEVKVLEKQVSDCALNRELTGLCVVCLETTSNHVLIPCYHICTCLTCALKLIDCPVCRSQITSVHKVFIL